MEFYLTRSIFAMLLILLLLRLLQIYKNFKKKISGFPFYNIASDILYCHLTGKIKKDTSALNVAFERFVEWGKQHWKEGYFMTFFSQPILFIYSEDAIKFFTSEKSASDKSPEYEIFAEGIKNGLATSNGQRWKKHRKLINPAFHTVMLKEKVPLFNIHALNLVTDMKGLVGKPSADICDILKFHYFSSLCESVLGVSLNEENREKILKLHEYVDYLGSMMAKRMICPWLRPKFLLNFFPSGREFIRKHKKCHDFVEKIISDMQKCVFSNNKDDKEQFGSHLRKSFAYILLNHHLTDPTFTFDDVHCEVSTIIAGETLRIFPVVPVFYRNLTDDVQYGKYKVFKGTTIAFFPYLSQRNPEIYPDPESFKPERFLNVETKKACSFIPFSEGSRSCIGKNYAVIEMKIFLSHILRNYKITSLGRRENVKLSYAIALLPVERLHFKIERRQT